ncbi:OLC1v1000863C2 [Oldenlandia corymbosa var. corymbosa]|uniref:OLC1v1000863C2 n=1 Tax=Oldenlandia corymbosa var. corymbosa TaxID=529605 RepID=A0AAV1D4S7_OLDCO|nr:OLC1v1000863C2 [Oldenlandia corymbosa var. corymbosa]
MKNMIIPSFFTFFLLFTFPCLIVSNVIHPAGRHISITAFEKLPLPVASTGALTFDLWNGGPYTGTVDGRILKYNKFRRIFEDFAYTSPERTKAFCDGRSDIESLQICGFPSGLSTERRTGKIYALDISLGLSEVRFPGGLTTNLVPSRDGVPYHVLDAVDAASNRKIYFVDASSVYGVREANISIQSGDSTGKLLEYDTRTKVVTELLTQLGGAVGVATDRDASAAYVSEYTARRIRKYYIRGLKAGTSEIFLSGLGGPYQIKRIDGEDNFWVAINNGVNETYVNTEAVKFNAAGQILAVLNLTQEFTQLIATVYQQGNDLFVAGFNTTYLGKYKLVYS